MERPSGDPFTSGRSTLKFPDSESSRALFFGVEEEFFLHDQATGRLVPRNLDILDAARRLAGDLDLELTSAQVETKTAVCWTARELRAELITARLTAAAAAHAIGAQIVATRRAAVTSTSAFRIARRRRRSVITCARGSPHCSR